MGQKKSEQYVILPLIANNTNDFLFIILVLTFNNLAPLIQRKIKVIFL